MGCLPHLPIKYRNGSAEFINAYLCATFSTRLPQIYQRTTGSLLALLGYPLLMQPALALWNQSLAWTIGYGALIALIAVCAVLLWRSSGGASESTNAATTGAERRMAIGRLETGD